MGVNCRINLPDNVRVGDVAKIIGIAAGCPRERSYFRDGIGWSVDVDGVSVKPTKCPEMVRIQDGIGWSVKVEGVCVKTTTCPEMARIQVGHTTFDGVSNHFVFYFFESSVGGRLLSPKSTAFWLAIGHRLVDFYGGSIDYSDSDNIDVNYWKQPKSRAENAPEDGDDWRDFQERLLRVQPLTSEEVATYADKAAYGDVRT